MRDPLHRLPSRDRCESAPPVIFDLDGVLTDTAELHYQSWRQMARELGVPFDRRANDALRGVSREESLRRFLGPRLDGFTAGELQDIMRRKNQDYLERVERMTPADLLPGIGPLLAELQARGARLAIASSSRNARAVVERLGIGRCFDAIVDGNDAPRSKPDPQVFLLAAERIRETPADCVVVEDAESGVAAGLAAGMRVVGVGPAERVGRAHVRVGTTLELTADLVAGAAARARTAGDR